MSEPTKSGRALRLLMLVVLVGILSYPIAYYVVAPGLEWFEQSKELAQLREMEKHAISPEQPPSPKTFYPIQVVSAPPRVTGFDTLDAREAQRAIHPDEIVLGVEVNGKARAYPLNIMTGPDREVFNDELGGLPIAATW